MRRSGGSGRSLEVVLLLGPLLALAFSVVCLAPVLTSQMAELPSWQLALLLSSDAAVVCSYLLLVWKAARRPSGEEPDPKPPLVITLITLVVMFGPDLAVSAWLGLEDLRARERSVEADGTVVRIEDAANSRMRVAHYVFTDRAGTTRTGSLRFPRVQRSRSIDLELLAALHGPLPCEVRLRYDPLDPDLSWLIGQDQSFDSLHEVSTAILLLQIVFAAIGSFVTTGPPMSSQSILSHHERVRATPLFVLSTVYLLQVLH